MRNIFPILACCAILAPHDLVARGGGFREGGIREESDRFGGDGETDHGGDDGIYGDSWGDRDVGVDDHDGSRGDTEAVVRQGGDGIDNVNVRTADGNDYDTRVVGPQGYRAGYVWRDGDYVAVDCSPWVPYVAPFGVWAGWNVVTQPDYVQYPVYASYPVETAVEVALQNLGIYDGPIDGDASSCSGAIEQYQEQNSLPVTGTITKDLLAALGIQADAQ